MALNPNGRTATVSAQIINDLHMSGVVLVIHPYEDGKGFSLNVYGADGPIRDFDFDEHGHCVGSGTAFSGSLDDVDGVEPGGWAAEDFEHCPECGSVGIAQGGGSTDNEDGSRTIHYHDVCGACQHVLRDETKTVTPPALGDPEAIAKMLGELAGEHGTGEVFRIEGTPDGPLTTTYDYEGNIIPPEMPS